VTQVVKPQPTKTGFVARRLEAKAQPLPVNLSPRQEAGKDKLVLADASGTPRGEDLHDLRCKRDGPALAVLDAGVLLSTNQA
jgi:hypothetical protein